MNLRGWAMTIGTLAAMSAWAASAKADIVFIDTNDQKVERDAAEKLGKKYGERVLVIQDGKQLDDLFRLAEQGKVEITTIVASGHSEGETFLGTKGYVGTFDALAQKYPKAAAQVRSFFGLGCYTGTPYAAGEWQRRFPGATVIAGFSGLAPTGDFSASFLTQVYTTIADAQKKAGSSQKLAEKLAGDKAAREGLERTLQTLDAMKATTGSYSVCGDFHDPKPMTKEKLEHQVNDLGGIYAQYFQGSKDLPKPHDESPLRAYYSTVQHYLRYAPDARKADLKKSMEQSVRLLYFDNVRKHWMKDHGADLKKLNEALKAANYPYVPEDDVTKMSRYQIVETANKLEMWRSRDKALQATADSFVSQLRDLDVPFPWIED
jgi:hypothetical protein